MSLPVFQATIVNDSGDIIPSAVMTVLDEITGLGLTVYSNRAGTVPLGTNGVFTADTDGFAQFFAPAGNYRVKAEQAASGFEKTWDFVPLVGGSAFDVDSYKEFGLGEPISVSAAQDLNDYYDVTFVITSGSTTNNPSVNGCYVITMGIGTTTATQTAFDAITGAIYNRSKFTTWSAWKRIDPQAFGLGVTASANVANVDTWTTSGSFRVVSSTVGNYLAQNGTLAHKSGFNADSATQKISYIDSDTIVERRKISGVWQPWQPVYTGANLNPNVFGGSGFVATGWAFSGTVARFLLPTHGTSDASSITLGGGTFDVLAGSTAITGGINTTAIALGSSGSNTPMGTVIQVSGLSGMVSGDFLQLYGDASNSQITVNF